MRILIVEDEALIAMVLADSLESAGHLVVGPASTMAEALALCEAMPPELALLDFNLADGSNGVDVARALLGRWGVPSIFASGEAVETRQARDIALGFIRKPYGIETVLRSVEVAREVLGGGDPRTVPAGFELFSPADGLLPAPGLWESKAARSAGVPEWYGVGRHGRSPPAEGRAETPGRPTGAP